MKMLPCAQCKQVVKVPMLRSTVKCPHCETQLMVTQQVSDPGHPMLMLAAYICIFTVVPALGRSFNLEFDGLGKWLFAAVLGLSIMVPAQKWLAPKYTQELSLVEMPKSMFVRQDAVIFLAVILVAVTIGAVLFLIPSPLNQ